MSKTCFLLGGDERQRWAAQALLDAGLEVRCCGVPACLRRSRLPPTLSFFRFPPCRASACAGPPHRSVPPCSPAAAAVHGSMAAAQPAAAGPARLRRGACRAFRHGAADNAQRRADSRGRHRLAVLHSPYRLHGAPCLVIGYGHIGRVLANKLHGLSARVTVAARRPSDRAAAEALGLEGRRNGPLCPRSCLSLCVQHRACTRADAGPARRASARLPAGGAGLRAGGIPACTRTDVTRIDAPGLPGRFCPASAGAAYAAAILEQEGAFPA